VITIQGIVSRVYSRRGGGAIFNIKEVNNDSSKRYRIKADYDVLPVQPSNGEIWEITGNSEYSDEYGNQLKALNCSKELPSGSILIDFLCRNNRFPGLGEKKANRLWSLFGENLYNILDNEDFDVLTNKEKGNISSKVANTIFTEWRAYIDEIPIIKWLQQYGFPGYLALRIYEVYGKESEKKLYENSYRLLAFCNWNDVDKLAFRLGINKDDYRRHAAAVDEVLYRHYADGNTAINTKELTSNVKKLLGKDNIIDNVILDARQQQTAVQIETDLYQSPGAYALEQYIKYHISQLLKPTSDQQTIFKTQFKQEYIHGFEKRVGIKLNDEQISAVKSTLNNRIICIIGGTGVGKTKTLSAIIKQIGPQWIIYQMALNNRAAQKITDATDHKATTISKFLLDVKDNELPDNCWLFIYESSMVDIPTAYRILKKLPITSRICFIGDPHQLPPVGPGLFFHVLTKSSTIPKVELKVIHKQARYTGIPSITLLIRKQIVPELEKYNGLNNKDYGVSFISSNSLVDIKRHILSVYRECINHGTVQIIAARQSTCFAINIELHNEHRELRKYEGKPVPPLPTHGVPVTIGDSILWHTKNDHARGIYSGTLGILTEIYNDPAHCIDEHGNEIEYVGVAEFDSLGTLKLTSNDMQYIKLGYCITIHSAQGSQFERAIIACEDAKIVDNSWLYTSLTRTQKQAIVIGSRNVFVKEASSAPRAFRRVIGLKI